MRLFITSFMLVLSGTIGQAATLTTTQFFSAGTETINQGGPYSDRSRFIEETDADQGTIAITAFSSLVQPGATLNSVSVQVLATMNHYLEVTNAQQYLGIANIVAGLGSSMGFDLLGRGETLDLYADTSCQRSCTGYFEDLSYSETLSGTYEFTSQDDLALFEQGAVDLSAFVSHRHLVDGYGPSRASVTAEVLIRTTFDYDVTAIAPVPLPPAAAYSILSLAMLGAASRRRRKIK